MAPFRANIVSMIHDTYPKFFPISRAEADMLLPYVAVEVGDQQLIYITATIRLILLNQNAMYSPVLVLSQFLLNDIDSKYC
jgi:hypothetical protein